jgi:hypothetical protein
MSWPANNVERQAKSPAWQPTHWTSCKSGTKQIQNLVLCMGLSSQFCVLHVMQQVRLRDCSLHLCILQSTEALPSAGPLLACMRNDCGFSDAAAY